MQKQRFIVFLLLPFAFSCRKDYACVCTADDPAYNMTQTANMTESAAQDWCIRMDLEYVLDDQENKKEGWSCELVEL